MTNQARKLIQFYCLSFINLQISLLKPECLGLGIENVNEIQGNNPTYNCNNNDEKGCARITAIYPT